MTLAPTLSPLNGLRYGTLGFALAFCALPLYVLMPNLYAAQWGVSLAALGGVLLGARLFDAVLDPWLGRLCDRLYAHSLGAVLAFGAIAAALLALGFSALFLPPMRDPQTLVWWAAACLMVTYVGYSALTVAHQSWGAMLGGNARQRSQIVAWREGIGLVGVMLAAVAPALWGIEVMLALLLVGLLVGWWAWTQGPRPLLPTQAAAPPSSHLWRAWQNRGFRRLVTVYMLNGIASAIPATLILFFVQDRLQASASMQSAYLGIYFLCGAVSMPLWLRLVRTLGLTRSWLVGMVLSITVFVFVATVDAGDVWWFLALCALSGVALGSDLAFPSAILAGVIDQAGDRGRADGVYFGWWNFATKLNLALAGGLTLPLLGWLGYAPGARDAHALQVLSGAYVLLPCALKTLAVVALWVLLIKPHATLD